MSTNDNHSDEEQQPQPSTSNINLADEVAKLTLKECEQFFNEKLRMHQCPACLSAAKEWSIFHDPNSYHGFLVTATQADSVVLPPPTIPLITMACVNCGYLRSHAAAAIVYWKITKT